MDEKLIIKSERYSSAKLIGIISLIGIVAPIVTFFALIKGYNGLNDLMRWGMNEVIICAVVLVIGIVLVILVSKAYSKNELTVTDKRVYGTATFGKRVDLPLDKVSAVGTGMFKTIVVTSSSGAIKFGMVKNCNEIHHEISTLLIARQSQSTATIINQKSDISNAEELKRFKELLDSGVISQAEFDEKKKQLLGL